MRANPKAVHAGPKTTAWPKSAKPAHEYPNLLGYSGRSVELVRQNEWGRRSAAVVLLVSPARSCRPVGVSASRRHSSWAGRGGYGTGDFRPAEASTSLVGRGLVRTPATAPFTRHCPRVRRSLDLANVRAQRRSVEPPYSTCAPGESGARSLSVQILFLTS